MKYIVLTISALALTACQTETPKEWRLKRSIRISAERECKDKKGTELYAKCVEEGIEAEYKLFNEIRERVNLPPIKR